MKISEIPKWIVDAVLEMHDEEFEEAVQGDAFVDDLRVLTKHYLISIGDERWRNLQIEE